MQRSNDDHTRRSMHMLRTIGKTVGSAMATLCLISTLAIAQTQSPPYPPSQTMTCAKDDGKGDCVAATAPDGKTVVVVGEGVKTGEKMTCIDTGKMINCTKLVVK